MILKAVAEGGGRGMRLIRSRDEIESVMERGAVEAATAFGSGELYEEMYLEDALHIEVQIVCDQHGGVSHQVNETVVSSADVKRL